MGLQDSEPHVPGMSATNLVVKLDSEPGLAATQIAEEKMQQSDQEVLEDSKMMQHFEFGCVVMAANSFESCAAANLKKSKVCCVCIVWLLCACDAASTTWCSILNSRSIVQFVEAYFIYSKIRIALLITTPYLTSIREVNEGKCKHN